MQKLLRRVATAERVVAKRNKLEGKKVSGHEKKEGKGNAKQQIDMAKEDIQAAKQSIRDQWELGSLAPRRDVGEHKGHYGAISEARFQSPDMVSHIMRERRCEWLGGYKNLNLAIGDRVVILEGPDKGKIGPIIEIFETKAEVTIEGLNKSNVQMPAQFQTKKNFEAMNFEIAIPISAVRLVHPVKDPKSGKTRDVIINQLVHGKIYKDRITGKSWWDRIVPSLNMSIPWPKEAEPDFKDFKDDTLRIDVEERTFVPSLLRPPMPEAIIDELRGKYSRFRTRHEPEYIARLEAEAQDKKARQELIVSMRTPLQEFHRAERANKKKKGKPRLTPEMLEKIGEVIAKNRERTLNSAGMSDVTHPSSNTASPASAPVDVSPPTDGQNTTSPTTSA